jgi:hypothetical protein
MSEVDADGWVLLEDARSIDGWRWVTAQSCRRKVMTATVVAWFAGVACALCACWLLYGAPLNKPMFSNADEYGETGARYIVGRERFQWFRKTEHNCFGGYTLDGRCISLVLTYSGQIKGANWYSGTIPSASKAAK